MSSVGVRLKREREARKTTIEEMSVATGIGQSYLEALEREEIEALPGPAFGKLYIRAYAEILGFDPQPWIEDYDREQRLVRSNLAEPAVVEPSRPRPVADAIARWKSERVAAEPAEPDVEAVEDDPGVELEATPPPVLTVPPEVTAPPEATAPPVATALPERPERREARRLRDLGLAGVVAIAFAIYFGMRPADGDKRDEPTRVTETSSAPAPLPPEPEPPPPVVAEPEKPAVKPPAVHQTQAGALSVTEFGVGRRMVKGRLESEGDRFEPWARVSFATRVTGGVRGAVLRHVWLHDGRVEQTITLRLGGPDWRTHSTKTLGRAGAWAVEARDEKGSVLARVEFNCGP